MSADSRKKLRDVDHEIWEVFKSWKMGDERC